MATNKQKTTTPRNPVRDAKHEAEKDIEMDPEFSAGDPTDDLDEGELARKDNSDEGGFDALEKKRPRSNTHPEKDGKNHPGNGK